MMTSEIEDLGDPYIWTMRTTSESSHLNSHTNPHIFQHPAVQLASREEEDPANHSFLGLVPISVVILWVIWPLTSH